MPPPCPVPARGAPAPVRPAHRGTPAGRPRPSGRPTGARPPGPRLLPAPAPARARPRPSGPARPSCPPPRPPEPARARPGPPAPPARARARPSPPAPVRARPRFLPAPAPARPAPPARPACLTHPSPPRLTPPHPAPPRPAIDVTRTAAHAPGRPHFASYRCGGPCRPHPPPCRRDPNCCSHVPEAAHRVTSGCRAPSGRRPGRDGRGAHGRAVAGGPRRSPGPGPSPPRRSPRTS